MPKELLKPGRDRKRGGRNPSKIRSRNESLAAPSYLALVCNYPIHPIRSEKDLDDAIAVVDGLLCRSLDKDEQDYLDVLSHEIERYESAAYPMPPVSAAAMVRHLLDARDVTLSEVSKGTGIVLSTLSAVLHGKRKLNLAHVQTLAAYFGVEPVVFLE
jgi:HTH-type transcriptional regulator / antitoxin HigA